jgi:hypothetical protein
MTEPFVAAAHLSRLKDFQRVTVQHVVDRMYDDASPTRRFLVADETGLGKSVVARGVIAEAVQRLLADRSVGRIDIVYVCSNADIAAQNLSRLNVVGNNRVEFRTRLTLLAAQSHDLSSSAEQFGKPVNLIAFTPATSFEKGWRTGRSDERALLAVLLQRLLGLRGARRTALHRALQGAVRSLDRFRAQIAYYDSVELDSTIEKQFEDAFRVHPAAAATERLIDDIGHRRSLSHEQWQAAAELTGTLRSLLARASVAALEPDLIILDEFQRFSHLLDIEKGGEAAELAHDLFEWDEARTLLLSATPYKPFTLVEEDAEGEDHYSSLMATLSFLCSGDESWMDQVRRGFSDYRTALLAGEDCAGLTATLRNLLLQYMCRTERPHVDGAHREVTTFADHVTPQDLADFVGLRQLAKAVGGAVQVEYWKSAPYFANFLEGYQVGDRLKEHLKAGAASPAVEAALGRVAQLDTEALSEFRPLDLGNARLRSLAGRTVGDSWWKLLWIPPSMPYLTPQGPYAEPFAAKVTKQLVFSSWSATPTAIASLLSYEADRRAAEGTDRLSANTAEARRRLATALTYRLTDGRPGAMSTLALFWPHPGLAQSTDPLDFARERPDTTGTADEILRWATDRLRSEDRAAPAVTAFFAWPGRLPVELLGSPHELSLLMQGSRTESDEDEASGQVEPANLDLHIEEALAVDELQLGSVGLAELALHSPGNVAWRSVGRLIDDSDSVTPEGHWAAAAAIANGLRSLFNRVESGLLLAQLFPGVDFWRAVLKYVSAGNLQAVMDEYLHHLRSSMGDESLDDDALGRLAKEAAATLSMRPSRYVAFDPSAGTTSISLGSRFALRYGSPRGKADDLRMPEVRSAFNSPFWPFVLTSTSVGQEGIDFHWWCHSVVHWNTPASPVDFEQREGRVNRFGGHGVRRNIALQHRADVMASATRDPWQAAYDAASCVRPDLGDFCPYWVYPGPYAVERHLIPFPLSQDGPRADALKRDLTLYRLALGQPRQEDLLALLKTGRTAARPIDLTPTSQQF